MASAVAFAYHNVGVRCLSVLLAHGVDVKLVVTHDDDPRENVWFGSVEALARSHDLRVAKPRDPNQPGFVQQIAALRPDFLFSFYYRLMLSSASSRSRRAAHSTCTGRCCRGTVAALRSTGR